MAALSPTATTAQHRDAPPLWKRIVSMVLLVIFGLSAILSVSAIWTNNQINDTDRYVRTVAPLASNPAIQQDLARTISLRLSKRLNDLIDTELTGDRAQLLAVPLSSAVNQYVESIVLEIVSSPQFEQLWTEIQRAAHTVVSAVLTGTNSDAITSKDGEIVLDLRPLVDQVIAQIKARGLDIVDRIPTDQIDTTFVIFQSDDLANVQGIVNLVNKLAYIFPIVALIACIGYLLLATDRWRAAMWIGITLLASMSLFLLMIATGRWQYLRVVDPSKLSPDAAAAFFDTINHYLRLGARVLGLVGLIIAIVAIIARPGGWARRHNLSPKAIWRDLCVKSPSVQRVGVWTHQHRKGVGIGIIGVFCIMLLGSSRISLGWAGIVLLLAVAAFVLLMIFQGGSGTLAAAGGAMPPMAVAGAVPPVATVPASASTPVQILPESTPVATEPVNVSPTAEEARKQLDALLDGMTPEEIQTMHRMALDTSARGTTQVTQPGERETSASGDLALQAPIQTESPTFESDVQQERPPSESGDRSAN